MLAIIRYYIRICKNIFLNTCMSPNVFIQTNLVHRANIVYHTIVKIVDMYDDLHGLVEMLAFSVVFVYY